MSTTIEYWDVNGTSLHTLAWNIETLQGRSRVPLLRGDNSVVTYRPGSIWRAKAPDSRVLSLAMWVLGCNTDGSAPSSGSARAKFNDNRDQLVRLFYSPDAQLSLTKRWITSTGLKTAIAQAELVSDMDTAMMGRDGAQFVVDLRLADPYFYGVSQNSGNIAVSTPLVVNNPGMAKVVAMTVRFTGSLTNPKLTNATPNPDVWVQYTGVISTGSDYVQLDTDQFTAVDDAAANVIGDITHAGSREWMVLAPGDNTLTLTASAGTGTALVTFQPPYI